MEMVPSSHACCACQSQDSSLIHPVSGLYVYLTEMRVEAEYALTMVDQDHVPINAEILGKDDFPDICCPDIRPAGGGDVYSQVNLLVNSLAVIEICAVVGITGPRATGHSAELSTPESFRQRRAAEFCYPSIVLSSHSAVCKKILINEFTLHLWIILFKFRYLTR